MLPNVSWATCQPGRLHAGKLVVNICLLCIAGKLEWEALAPCGMETTVILMSNVKRVKSNSQV